MNSILFSVENGVAKITLNRPKVYNSINREMALAIQKHLDQAATDDDIRAVYITANGKAFCACYCRSSGNSYNQNVICKNALIRKIDVEVRISFFISIMSELSFIFGVLTEINEHN